MKMTKKRARRCASIRPAIEAGARKAGVDGTLMLAVAWVESGFSARARSGAGAIGVMQLLRRTSRAFGCDDPTNVRCAAFAASRLYARLMVRFDGAHVYALCAYNAGAGRIRKSFSGGELPFNRSYADRVLWARDRLATHGCTADAR